MKRPVAVDLFCGAGGMSLGFERAGFDIVLAVDHDPHHCATHARNFPTGRTVCRSIADLHGPEVLDWAGGHVDLLFGGPPCQGFSTMGVGNEVDDRNDMVAEFVRLVEEVGPRAVVMENVPGMLARRTRAILDQTIRRLEAAGYSITRPVRVLNAKDFGVPQDRSRLFLLATRAACPIPYPIAAPAGLPSRPTVAEAIADLPDVDDSPAATEVDAWPYRCDPRHPYAAYARGVLTPCSDHGTVRRWDTELCVGCRSPYHSPTTRSLYDATAPGTMVPGHKLPRLEPDGIAPTLRAGTDSSRGSHTAPRPVHPFKPRCITWREAARLHGYPDWFCFYPGMFHSYRQIGNSVCPPVAHAIGVAVREALMGQTAVTRNPAVDLPEIDRVAGGEGGRERRRVHRVELAKVLDALVGDCRSAGVAAAPRRVHPADIEKAVRQSGADLPRIPADRFGATLARSRSVGDLLRALEDRGLTIVAPIHRDGSFDIAPLGSGTSIAEIHAIRASSREIRVAEQVPVATPLPNDLNALAQAGRRLAQRVPVHGQQDLFDIVPTFATRQAEVSHTALLTWMRRTGAQTAVVVARMTEEHLLVAIARAQSDGIQVLDKRVFRGTPRSIQAGLPLPAPRARRATLG